MKEHFTVLFRMKCPEVLTCKEVCMGVLCACMSMHTDMFTQQDCSSTARTPRTLGQM